MVHQVIYLPGIADHANGQVQIDALKKWHKHGIRPYFQPLNWNSEESYKEKISKVLHAVDELAKENVKISLIGVSAGASMAINVFAQRPNKVDKVILICGKINNPQTLGGNYKKQNPALVDSVSASAANAKALSLKDKQKMLTINPIFDGTVSKSDSRINGVRNKTIFSILHPLSIYLAITLYRKTIIGFLKSRAH